MFVPRVVDIYHGDAVAGSDGVDGFKRAAAAGVWGIIHKATQGASYKDPAYSMRRKAAEASGLLWGAYHFNTAEPIAAQAIKFLDTAAPDANTSMWLDFENNAKGDMNAHQAITFMKLVEDRIGRQCGMYSGNRIKETIKTLSSAEVEYLTSRRLWLCQYGPHAVLPPGFKSYYLWQYTGDGMGSAPHYVDGITVPGGKGIDLNVYDGTIEQLKATWAGAPVD